MKTAAKRKPEASAYAFAQEAYARVGIDTERAIASALEVPISLHCWQTDDVRGLEPQAAPASSGGLLATGAHPGRARSGDEMRSDIDLVLRLLPGGHRLNLHACYAETGGRKVDRDSLETRHFSNWMQWSAKRKIALDFNPTYFAHPKAADGFTLSHSSRAIREFWIAHGAACRRIARDFCENQGSPCVLNHWIPDGTKDLPADRLSPRARLRESLDAVLADRTVDSRKCVDAVEGKLFGLGSEEYVVGSHEFYSSYAQLRGIVPCLDMGHYHPTESVADKISALLPFHPRLLLHASRPVRWDSDHVVILDDALRQLFLEIGRADAWKRVFVALDYFDASINRIAAYVIGARATRQAILLAFLDPAARLRIAENAGRNHERLALMELSKSLPWAAVWDRLCARADVPAGIDWLKEVDRYESRVLSRRQ